MKKFLFFLSFIAITSSSMLFGQQTSWQWVNPLPQGNILNSIWSVNADTVYAVGDFGTVLKSINGGRNWQVSHKATGIVEALYAAHFISGTTGWVTGEGGQILKTTDAGSTWFSQSLSFYTDIYAVNFISPTQGWVAGAYGKIYSTTNGGNSWVALTSGTANTLYNISFLNPLNGWAVGTDGTILNTTDGGISWNKKVSNTSLSLYAIQFTSGTVGYTTGAFGLMLKTTDGGNTWVPQASGTDFSLFSLHFESSLVGWATGTYGVVIKTTNGGLTWFEQTSPTVNDLFAIHFASPANGWAVGDFGTIANTTDGGATWTLQSTGVRNILNAISFSSPTYGVAVGEEGTVVRTTDGGSSWVQQTSGVIQTLYGVHMISDLTGWAVGDSAVIIRTTNGGLSWIEQNSHLDLSLYSVYFLNSSYGWTVGDFGTILATNNGGSTWHPETSDVTTPFLRIKFFNTNVGWVVGYSGEIYKTVDGGSTWLPQLTDTYQTLYAIEILDFNTLIASGDFGTILKSTNSGNDWVTQPTDATESFYGLAFSSQNRGWAVGDDGAIINTTDGGSTWSYQTSGTLNTLWEVQFIRSSATGGTLYSSGIGGTILASGVSPLPLRTWTGIADSVWTSPGNWNPYGVPEKGDSVYIPITSHNPVLRTSLQQINLGALHIGIGSKLTIASGLSQLVVSGNINIEGSLDIENSSILELFAGSLFQCGPYGRFNPGMSTVTIFNSALLKGNFYNLILTDSASSQSVGNIAIKNNLTALSNMSMRLVDTLTILNPDPQGFQGQGIITSGSIKRAIRKDAGYEYRFESPVTFLRFYPDGTIPDTILVTAYPNMLGPGLSDTAFVYRYYDISAIGGNNYMSSISLRYDTSETSISIDNLALFRDSSGIIKNMGVTDFLDSDLVAISLDSVRRFSRWYLGMIEYYWKHPLEFLDSLIITDHGMISDTLVFGTYPGASDGLDTLMGEFELGSIPPSGTFDARWIISGTPGSKIDIHDIIGLNHQEVTFRATFQPGTGGYPVTLRWDPSVIPIGSILLQDALTGGAQFSVDMKSQGSFTISNPTIQSFQIVYKAPRYYSFNTGWNMLSMPLILTGNKNKSSIFPTAISDAFSYYGMYLSQDTLTNGIGYWLKFLNPDTVGIEGIPSSTDTIQVLDGWNLIGALTLPVSVNSVQSIPANIRSSDFFAYTSGYQASDSIRPAKAYWIKTKSAGSLILASTGPAANQMGVHKQADLQQYNSVDIRDPEGNKQTLYFSYGNPDPGSDDQFELPPLPPTGVFDIRFSGNKMVKFIKKDSPGTVLAIQAATYPLTIEFHLKETDVKKVVISEGASGQVLSSNITSSNSVLKIHDPSVKSIKIRVTAAGSIPMEYSLRQNYPNPFNPSTTIEYGLPEESFVTIKIFNILGQEVAVPVNNEHKDAGIYQYQLMSTDIRKDSETSSGIYFYRITARGSSENFIDVRKMLYVK